MKAAPMTQKPSFPLMKQGDIQNIYHLQMPRWLFTDHRYRPLPLEAKVAYTFLLNRFQLSRLNGWINDDGEVFIVYTRRSLASEIQVSYHKIIESMKALTAAGLIWERRCGRGDANQIYLALVTTAETADSDKTSSAPFIDKGHEAAGAEPEDEGRDRVGAEEGCAPNREVPFDQAIRSPGAELLDPAGNRCGGTLEPEDVSPMDFKRSGKSTSRSLGMESPEVPNRASNYTEKSKNDNSHTEFSPSAYPAAYSDLSEAERRAAGEGELLSRLLEQCELWTFEPEVAKVLENAIERLFYSESFRVGKAILPQANVRSQLWGLDGTILQTAVGKLRRNQSDIKNSTAYTMAVVFNAIGEARSDLLVDPYLNSLQADDPSGW